MSNAALGMTMLCLIVVVIMMGFPTAFTLMGLGMLFGSSTRPLKTFFLPDFSSVSKPR